MKEGQKNISNTYRFCFNNIEVMTHKKKLNSCFVVSENGVKNRPVNNEVIL